MVGVDEQLRIPDGVLYVTGPIASKRMRWERPTRLPVIDYDGEKVFGANVVTDTGVVLYVASGR